jgi:hypothetical protein
MQKYSVSTIKQAQKLRSLGKTYTEINQEFHKHISKSTLSFWFKHIKLPSDYKQKIKELNIKNLDNARLSAVISNKRKREAMFDQFKVINVPIAKKIQDINTSKIALSMLCLGEASKYNPKTRAGFYLGSSNPKIILLFINLLKKCFDIRIEKIRCTVQCRADQNAISLENYWQKITQIPKNLFYKTRIDPRTQGKPTKKADYKGVLRIDYLDRKIQLELESLADLVYNEVCLKN